MGEPIILDGGDQMVTIKLPSSFKKNAKEEGQFSVSPVPANEPFQSIVITDTVTGKKVCNVPINDKQWKIEIK